MKIKGTRKKQRIASSVMAVILSFIMMTEPVLATDNGGVTTTSAPEIYASTPNRDDILGGDGDFEEGVTINVNSASGGTWNRTAKGSNGCAASIVKVDDAPSGEYCLYYEYAAAGDPEPSLMYKNYPSIIAAGQTYTLELYVKRMSAEAVPYIQLWERKDGGAAGLIDKFDLLPEGTEATKNIGEWVKITHEFTTGTAVEGANQMRLEIRGLTTAGTSCYFDNLTVVGKKTPSEVAADAFLDKVAAEKAASMQVIQDDGDPTVRKEAIDGVANLLINGDFTMGVENWVPNKHSADYYRWSSSCGTGGIEGVIGPDGAESVEGDGCMEVLPRADRSPAIKHMAYDIQGGAEYQLTFNYKIDAGTTAVPSLQFECFVNTEEPGDTGHIGDIEFDKAPTEFVNDGKWHSYTYRVRVPARTEYMEVFVGQLLGSNGSVYYDDVTFCMTNSASLIYLNQDMKFFYTDMQDENTLLTATVQTNFFPEYADGNVVFQVYDGQTEVWKSEPVAVSDSIATVELPLSNLAEIDTPYVIKATLFDNDTEIDATSRTVYMYDRPTALDENGNYIKFGEDFVPVMGYHVYDANVYSAFGIVDIEHFGVVGEAGMNVIPMRIGETAEQCVATLDYLQSLGLKGMVSLYHSRLPAGHEDNIARTIEVISDERVRNHPALFGYNIADEPFIHELDARQSLENSYRLIRQYDTENIITFVEDLEYMIPESSSFADALIVDPYYAAAGASIYNIIKQAKDDMNFAKPLWGLFQTYIHHTGYFNTLDDVRNNNYQALFAGADGYGYFSISDSGNVSYSYLDQMDDWKDLSWPTTEGYIPLWEVKTPDNAGAGAEVWEGLKSFTAKEAPIIDAYFAAGKGTKTAEEINIEAGYMYHAWTAEDGTDYLAVLNVKGDDVHVDIPVSGASAKIVAGREDTQLYAVTDGELSLDLVNVEALLLEMTDIPASGEAEYALGTGEAVSVKVDADALDGVAVGDTALEADKDYTVDADADTLTFSEEYLEALLPGDYVVKLTYGDVSVEAVLTILAEELSVVTEKSDLGYQKGDEEGAKIYSTGTFSRFQGIKKDGVEVDSANYTAEEGSTVITFTKAYMESLSDGEHVFELVFRDGSINATVQVTTVADEPAPTEAPTEAPTAAPTAAPTEAPTVAPTEAPTTAATEAPSVEPNGDTADDESSDVNDTTDAVADTPSGNSTAGTPETGDDSNMLLWCILFVFAIAGILAIGFVYRRKQK